MFKQMKYSHYSVKVKIIYSGLCLLHYAILISSFNAVKYLQSVIELIAA